MDIVSVLSNPGAVVGKVTGAIVVALPLASAVSSIILTKLPAPKNLRTGYAILYRWLEYLSLSIGHGKTAIRAKLNGEVVPVIAPGTTVSITGYGGVGPKA